MQGGTMPRYNRPVDEVERLALICAIRDRESFLESLLDEYGRPIAGHEDVRAEAIFDLADFQQMFRLRFGRYK